MRRPAVRAAGPDSAVMPEVSHVEAADPPFGGVLHRALRPFYAMVPTTRRRRRRRRRCGERGLCEAARSSPSARRPAQSSLRRRPQPGPRPLAPDAERPQRPAAAEGGLPDLGRQSRGHQRPALPRRATTGAAARRGPPARLRRSLGSRPCCAAGPAGSRATSSRSGTSRGRRTGWCNAGVGAAVVRHQRAEAGDRGGRRLRQHPHPQGVSVKLRTV